MPSPARKPVIKQSSTESSNSAPRPRIKIPQKAPLQAVSTDITAQGDKTGLIPQSGGPGAPHGNKNGHNARIWKLAIMNALKKRGKGDQMVALEQLAEKLILSARRGSIPALREVGDRLDGKAAQALVGDPDNPIIVKHVKDMSDEELEALARDITSESVRLG